MRCPICGRTVEASAPAPAGGSPPAEFPFCSRRCRLLDLGRWLRGEYCIPGAPVDPESPEYRSAAERPEGGAEGRES